VFGQLLFHCSTPCLIPSHHRNRRTFFKVSVIYEHKLEVFSHKLHSALGSVRLVVHCVGRLRFLCVGRLRCAGG
jgi:hypothetical protein